MSWIWGSRQIKYIDVQCTMDIYKTVEIFEVRGPRFHPKPFSILKPVLWVPKLPLSFIVRGTGFHHKLLSILIKIGMCIAIWCSCIVIIAACWHKSWFLGSGQIYIDVQWISIRK